MVKQRNPWNWGRSYGKSKAKTPQPPAAEAVTQSETSTGSNQVNPWHKAGTHAKLNATVPEGVILPAEWGDLNLAHKREWLDANAV